MLEISSSQWFRLAARYGGAVVAVIGATLVVFFLPGELWLPSGVLVYLVAVLAVAVLAGRGPAIGASVLALLAFDFFFTEPRFTLAVRDPNEWIALLTFLVVAVVTSHLAARQHERLIESEAREREARLLHDLADLLVERSLLAALSAVGERLRRELDADAVVIVVDAEPVVARAEAGDAAAVAALRGVSVGPMSVLGEGHAASGVSSGEPGRWVRIMPPHTLAGREVARGVARVPIRRDDQLIGQLLIKWRGSQPPNRAQARLLDTAAGQLAVAVDRDRLRLEANEAEVLRRTSELKTALLDAVSHDLRTPLASIVASAGSLRQTDVDWSAEDRLRFAEAIEQEANRLNRIVGNLLDLSRIRQGTLVPSRDWHDPGVVLLDTLERLRHTAGGHRLVLDVADDLRPVLLDPVEIDQVVANLVENAVKYGPAGGEIRVSASIDDDQLTVRVDDSGPGVAARAIPSLFEPFYRGVGADAAGGSGLGLAVARGLVQAHGGRIWVENRPSGGARFSFAIPAPRPAAIPAPP